ncbi:DNA polymerase III subunit psi [Vibrio algivorus]|uniref:DNA polymerase III subunit psi n=1 Tax=Vibrio algivorus TaxID=1667024 RepID=A0ABQ6EPM9_9VIBR|nr:DNA polymerase III subunit psi [Vibrio algivorus]GLT14882.1 DNA polymerase III subunit psi [Vibrio algivorus]
MLDDSNLELHQPELRQQSYLKEMGISTFEVAHPDKLEGYQSPGIILPNDCVLLLVAESCPQGEDATLFIKVLASMKLQPEQALHLTPGQLTQLQQHNLKWVWFAGCDGSLSNNDHLPQWQLLKLLHSPALSTIHGNTQNRRDLWQQICSYD